MKQTVTGCEYTSITNNLLNQLLQIIPTNNTIRNPPRIFLYIEENTTAECFRKTFAYANDMALKKKRRSHVGSGKNRRGQKLESKSNNLTASCYWQSSKI